MNEWSLVAGVVGVLAGPLLRARIFRHAVPAERLARETCPDCDRQLVPGGWRGLVTMLSPTGNCPNCHSRIGPAPGLVELAGGVSFALLALVSDVPLVLAALWWVAAVGVALGFIDVSVHRLPDRLTVTGYAGALLLLSVAALAAGRFGDLGWAVLYGLFAVLFYLILAITYPAGMGLGDVKLALVLGLVLGWFGGVAMLLGVATGFLLGGCYAAALLISRRAGRRDLIPHGPFMLLGSLLVLVLIR